MVINEDYTGLRLISKDKQCKIDSALRLLIYINVILKICSTHTTENRGVSWLQHKFTLLNESYTESFLHETHLEKINNLLVLRSEETGDINLESYIKVNPLALKYFIYIVLQMIDIIIELHYLYLIHKKIKSANFISDYKIQKTKLVNVSLASHHIDQTQT